jgi:hypothetical protein
MACSRTSIVEKVTEEVDVVEPIEALLEVDMVEAIEDLLPCFDCWLISFMRTIMFCGFAAVSSDIS